MPGVAEVATFGGVVKKYQFDTNRLLALLVPLRTVIDRIQDSNSGVGLGGKDISFRPRQRALPGEGDQLPWRRQTAAHNVDSDRGRDSNDNLTLEDQRPAFRSIVIREVLDQLLSRTNGCPF
jgi:hypothetical protein